LRLEVLFCGGNIATLRGYAAAIARRPAGTQKDGSVFVGADHEEGIERRSGNERRVRCKFYAGLAGQSGGKREVVVAAATAAAAAAATVMVCARARVYRTIFQQLTDPYKLPATRLD